MKYSSDAKRGDRTILPYLDTEHSIGSLFHDVSIYDATIYVNVYLDKTSDAQVREGGRKNLKKRIRKSKKARNHSFRRGCTKLKRI